MFKKILLLTFSTCVLLISTTNVFARNGVNASITSGPLFVDDINGLDHKVSHTQTYTYTLQMESDVNIKGATLGFVLYSPDGSLTTINWDNVVTNIGPWGADSTWSATGPALIWGPNAFNGSLPSIWMTGGISTFPSPQPGYGPIGLTDGLTFTITFPGVDGGVLCLDSALYPQASKWLYEPFGGGLIVPEWSAGSGDQAVGGTSTTALCVTTFSSGTLAEDNVSVDIAGLGIVADDINGLDAKVGHFNSYTYTLSYEAETNWGAATLGMVLYSPDGSLTNINWTSDPTVINLMADPAVWNLVPGAVTLGADAFDGTLPSRFMVGGVALGSPGSGYGPVASTPGAEFTISFPGVLGGILCIDSAFFPPAGEWLAPPATPNWSGGGGDLSVGGSRDNAYCVTTYEIPPPELFCIEDNSGGFVSSHCDAVNFIQTIGESGLITYSISHNGLGVANIDGAGNGSYVPGAGEVGVVTITVEGDQFEGSYKECVFDITLTNNAPTLVCPPNIAVAKGSSGTSPPANASDADACDVLVYSWVSTNPAPVGSVTVDPETGAVTFDADIQDAVGGSDTDFEVCISVTDGIDVTECCMVFSILPVEALCISIDQTDKNGALGTLQGHQAEVCINFDGGSNEVGGFDFLIQYDNSALSFVGANPGNIFADYQWEYFTYRFGPNGNCSGACPSGTARIIGLAEQNDGSHHPTSTALVVGDDFACLTFLVSNDRNLECNFVPIRWTWLDCGDNALSSPGGDTLYVSRFVYDYIGTDNYNIVFGRRANITGADQSFPTLTGAPDVCDVATDKGAPLRFADFKNGGIKIICAEDIDARGDINLNGISNEIADAVMLTDYMVSGLSAFGSHIEGSIAASEINADGIPLTVADLVYLIRIIVGDALPLPKLSYNSKMMVVKSEDELISINTEIGAALFIFDGIADVSLLANNTELKVGEIEGNTHALIYNIGDESITAGSVIATNGSLISVQAADYNGVALSTTVETAKPKTFMLHQNFPNPFNPSTTIKVDFPRASDFELTIYNISGQKVDQQIGTHSAGTMSYTWSPEALPSGVYFYKLQVGDFIATKKLMLLK